MLQHFSEVTLRSSLGLKSFRQGKWNASGHVQKVEVMPIAESITQLHLRTLQVYIIVPKLKCCAVNERRMLVILMMMEMVELCDIF